MFVICIYVKTRIGTEQLIIHTRETSKIYQAEFSYIFRHKINMPYNIILGRLQIGSSQNHLPQQSPSNSVTSQD